MSIRVVIRTLRNHRQGVDHVGTGAERADRHHRAGSAHIHHYVRGGRRGRHQLAGFQAPLLLGGINDAEVVDTGIRLRGLTGAHEVGNRDRRQKADDGHDDHDFHQREAEFTMVFERFHFLLFCFSCGRI